jgi:hypothetical protein
MGVPGVIFSLPWGMFIRKKKNKSGLISVQIIDKSFGKYKVFKTLGSSNDPQTIKHRLIWS